MEHVFPCLSGDFKAAQERYLSERRLIVDAISSGDRNGAVNVTEGPITAHADDMTRALLTLQRINNDQAGFGCRSLCFSKMSRRLPY